MSDDGTSLRNRLIPTLPKLLGKVVDDYEKFSKQTPPLDAKGFAAHQAACKSSLAHLTAGIKLLAWIEEPTPNGRTPVNDLEKMISDAEAALARGLRRSGK